MDAFFWSPPFLEVDEHAAFHVAYGPERDMLGAKLFESGLDEKGGDGEGSAQGVSTEELKRRAAMSWVPIEELLWVLEPKRMYAPRLAAAPLWRLRDASHRIPRNRTPLGNNLIHPQKPNMT